ncbi:MAG: RHS domain-containing protein [Gammaproteobacteria bacterium]|nr:RHS domain-containing protein [Gammaproteobacteria bacterium]
MTKGIKLANLLFIVLSLYSFKDSYAVSYSTPYPADGYFGSYDAACDAYQVRVPDYFRCDDLPWCVYASKKLHDEGWPVCTYGVSYWEMHVTIYTVPDQFSVAVPDDGNPQSCPAIGNPINPTTGNKFHKEPIVNINAIFPIDFNLYYNSMRIERWRHTYSRSININTALSRYNFNNIPYGTDPFQKSASPGGLTGFEAIGRKFSSDIVRYYTPDAACMSGWNQYKLRLHYSWVGKAVAEYDRGECAIRVDGKTKMRLPIYNLITGRRYASTDFPVLPKLEVYREDGRKIEFYKVETNWVNYSKTGEVLSEKLDDSNALTGYLLTNRNNEVEEYNISGQLLSITSSRGHSQRLDYVVDAITGQTLLHRVTNDTGEFVEFGYELTGDTDQYQRIHTVSDHTGRSWSLRYDINGNPEYVDFPDLTHQQYHYEDPEQISALTGITDRRGIRYSTWAYNEDGKAILSAHGSSQDIDRGTIDYQSNGLRTFTNQRKSGVSGSTEIISTAYKTHAGNGSGLVASIDGPGCTTCGANDIQYEYDPATDYLEYKIEHGIRTDYGDYDDKGNPGYIVEAVGTADERRTDYTYDARFIDRPATVTEPSVLGGEKKVTSYSYDDLGNLLSITINGFSPDGTPVSRTTRMQYNGPYYQLSLIDGPRTDVLDTVTFDYYPNAASEGNNRARLKSVTAADGSILQSEINYTATGKVESEKRSNNLLISYEYYAASDLLVSMTQTDVTMGKVQTTHWTYLPTGEVESITHGKNTLDETRISFAYDDARRLTRVIDGLGHYIEYILDSDGNVEQESIHDAAGSLKKTLSQTYDLYNHLDVFGQQNETIDYDYADNGQLASKTDGKGSKTVYAYDALSKLTSVTEDLFGVNPSTANALTRYGYDMQDNLTTVIDANEGQTSYVYDDLGNLLSQTSPDTGTTVFSHDEAGNVVIQTDAKGQIFYYQYDLLGRLINSDAPGEASDLAYVYDICTNGVGRLCQVVQGVTEQTIVNYSYDAFGNVTEHQGVVYAYDGVGRVNTLTYPSGAMISYSYDAAGQIVDVDYSVDGVVKDMASQLAYAPMGAVESLVYGNGLVLTQGLDGAYRYTSHTVTDPLMLKPNALTLSNQQYDANGNLIYSDDALSTASLSSYGYDAHHRLQTATGNYGSKSYGYDQVGNRLSIDQDGLITSYSYDINSNRMNQAGGEGVILDEVGNTLIKGDRSFTYTENNRLREIYESTELLASYAYNGLGQRISKTLNQADSGSVVSNATASSRIQNARGIAVASRNRNRVTRGSDMMSDNGADNRFGRSIFNDSVSETVTQYVYGLNGELLAELSATGEVQKEYVYLNGQPLSMVAYTQNPDGSLAHQLYYIHNNHLGTPQTLTDETGNLVWRAEYTPFGLATVFDDVDGDGQAVSMNVRMPGQYFDGESGFYYNYYRYYDPETGRYITSDPIGLAGGVNTYLYANANPLKYIDPDGRWALPVVIVVVTIEAARTAYAWQDVKAWERQANTQWSRSQDYQKHEWISQQITIKHGADVAAIYGIGKELYDLTPLGGTPDWRDLEADWNGIKKGCGF